METYQTEPNRLTNPKKPARRAKTPIGVKVFQNVFKLGRVSPKLMGRFAYTLWFRTNRNPLTKKEKEYLREARHYKVPFGSKEIAAFSWGNSHKKVLLAHGWLGRGIHMRFFIAPFLKAGYEVIALDAPAHGQSPGKQSELFEYGDAIQTVGKLFGPFEGVCTHSVGAISTLIALNQGFKAKRIVCYNTPCRLEAMVQYFSETLQIPKAAVLEMGQLFEKNYGKDCWDRASGDTYAKHLSIPALIIHDRDDREIPIEEGRQLAKVWKNSKFIETAGLGHRRILRDDGAISKSVRFIGRE